jgi:hypothetical protein
MLVLQPQVFILKHAPRNLAFTLSTAIRYSVEFYYILHLNFNQQQTVKHPSVKHPLSVTQSQYFLNPILLSKYAIDT